jgi:hypothetical protein
VEEMIRLRLEERGLAMGKLMNASMLLIPSPFLERNTALE